MLFFKTSDSWGGLILRIVLGSVIFAHATKDEQSRVGKKARKDIDAMIRCNR